MVCAAYKEAIGRVRETFGNLKNLDNKYKIGGLSLLGAGAVALYFNTPGAANAASDVVKQLVRDTAETIKEYGFESGLIDGLLFDLNLIMSLLQGGINKGASLACDGYGITSEPNTGMYWLGYLLTGGLTNTGIGAIVSSRRDD